MRDIIISLIVFGALPFVFTRPQIGILLWSWIGYMNPHRLAYGFAYSFPFAAIIGLVTIAGVIISREPKRIPWSPVTVIWILFIFWMTITTFFAFFPDEAWPQWKKVMKIELMTFLTILVMVKKERIEALVWVIVVSIGFYAVKGGIFTILTGGKHLVLGPEGSFIEDNNGLAFALVMLMPLMRYLQVQATNKWISYGLSASMVLCALSILSAYSRGAILALVICAGFIWLKSRNRVLIGVALLVAAPLLWQFMPEKWVDRMNTVQTYEQDESAMGRIYVWKLSAKIASEYFLFGGGFGTFHTRYFHELYGAEITDDDSVYIATDAHSVYFKVLGDHGYIGLFLFLMLWLTAYQTGKWIMKHSKDLEGYKWAYDLAAMIQVSLIGYAIGGAFIGRSYFDLYYQLIAILIVLRFIVNGVITEQQHNERQPTMP